MPENKTRGDEEEEIRKEERVSLEKPPQSPMQQVKTKSRTR